METSELRNDNDAISAMGWFESEPIVVKSIKDVIGAIEKKQIRLPLYQRDSIWDEGRICALWDSILRGFPLPSFFLTEGKGDSRGLSSEGEKRDATLHGGDYFDILDGQQRLTAITQGFNSNNSIRLWLDLAPPVEEKHPFQFSYWIHPCTSTFPYGFKMRSAGEQRFEHLSDHDIRCIWNEIQNNREPKIQELFEMPLGESFPWSANCPIPLDALLAETLGVEDKNTIRSKIVVLVEKWEKKLLGKTLQAPNPAVVEKLTGAIEKLQGYKLALQKITVEDDAFTLFERIGRGGVPLTQKQLAVSQLMLEMGIEANDAVARFQKGNWRSLLDTEEIIHAISRVSHAKLQKAPDEISDDHDWKEIAKWDMSELDLEKIREIKRDGDKWEMLKNEMKSNCKILEASFNAMFSDILHVDLDGNEHGFSLVQLAQTAKEGGIQPITLHPLLYWAFYIRKAEEGIGVELRKNMLQWIIFSNGIVSNPSHKKLNHLAMHEIAKNNILDFIRVKKVLFLRFSEKELEEVGLSWSIPVLDVHRNEIVEKPMSRQNDVPNPKDIVERTFRRLVLRNWVDKSGVNNFVLMWNQREMLHKIYGKINPQHIQALYGKGRPIDADHIVARNRLSGHYISIANDSIQAALISILPDSYKNIRIGLNENTFRLNFPNLNGNFRYWPKHLNRSDKDCRVIDKLPTSIIIDRLGEHPLSLFFDKNDLDVGWKWSAIKCKSKWENLPSNDLEWAGPAIIEFMVAVLEREFDLYANAYAYLMQGSEGIPPVGTFNLNDLVSD